MTGQGHTMHSSTTFAPIALLALCCAWAAAPASAEPAPQAPAVRAEHVAGHVHLIYGRGGNIGVSAGADGVFLIDDQYAPLAPAILEAVRGISDAPLRFVLNTHWHGDHTGGNEQMAGQGALIIAHDNVRRRLSTEQFIAAFGSRVPPSPPTALPVVTFSQSLTLHFNGDAARMRHAPHAHTDGDGWVQFERADVIHAGDLFFNGMYPFIDLSSGGSIDGLIRAVGQMLDAAGPRTRIIPGHGPLADRAALAAYRDMLVTVRGRVAALIADGADRDAAIAARPTADLDAQWGGGFLKPEQFVRIVHDSLAAATGGGHHHAPR